MVCFDSCEPPLRPGVNRRQKRSWTIKINPTHLYLGSFRPLWRIMERHGYLLMCHVYRRVIRGSHDSIYRFYFLTKHPRWKPYPLSSFCPLLSFQPPKVVIRFFLTWIDLLPWLDCEKMFFVARTAGNLQIRKTCYPSSPAFSLISRLFVAIQWSRLLIRVPTHTCIWTGRV